MTTSSDDQQKKETFYLTRPFVYGMLCGVIIMLALSIGYIKYTRSMYALAPQPVYKCSTIPNDPREGLRIGTDMTRTPEQTSELNKLFDDFVARYDISHGTDTSFKTGGRISRCALYCILNSLNKDSNYVDYRFGLDQYNRTLLVLKGGSNDPFGSGAQMGQPLILRTGSYDDCFCPVHCGNWLLGPEGGNPTSVSPTTTE